MVVAHLDGTSQTALLKQLDQKIELLDQFHGFRPRHAFDGEFLRAEDIGAFGEHDFRKILIVLQKHLLALAQEAFKERLVARHEAEPPQGKLCPLMGG